MKLIQSILTRNPCYTAGRKIAVKGLMLHLEPVAALLQRELPDSRQDVEYLSMIVL